MSPRSEVRSVVLEVPGTPAPQGSKRHVGGGRMVESSKRVGPWRDAIVAAAIRANVYGLRVDYPVSLTVSFNMVRPTAHYGARGLRPSAPMFPATRPDLDKLLRSTLDGLVQASVLADDSVIVVVSAGKFYADDEDPPGAGIHLNPLGSLRAAPVSWWGRQPFTTGAQGAPTTGAPSL